MKDEVHHLKHVQKRVLRSVRQNSAELSKQPVNSSRLHKKTSNNEGEVYDEVIPSNQQIPRAPGRVSYH